MRRSKDRQEQENTLRFIICGRLRRTRWETHVDNVYKERGGRIKHWKMTSLDARPLCVFGNKDRAGRTARKYLIEEQIGPVFDELKIAKALPAINEY